MNEERIEKKGTQDDLQGIISTTMSNNNFNNNSKNNKNSCNA